MQPLLSFRIGRRRLVAAAAAVTVTVAAAAVPAAATGGERTVFMPPVQAPVSDPFRPPDGPYGAGNRGIEYDTRPGQVVRAAAGGTVSFAGTVAGELHVTVDHGGGVLSTYSYLERISVRTGAEVTRGETVGLSGELLHFSVRVDGQYVDPAGFVGVRRVRVRLVPLRVQRHRAAGAAGSVHLPVGLTGPDGAMAASPNHFATRAFTRSP